jgi:hypothetical protein
VEAADFVSLKPRIISGIILITSATAAPDAFPSGSGLAAEVHMACHGQPQRITRWIHHRPGQLTALPWLDAGTGAGAQRKKATQKGAQKTIHDHKPEMGQGLFQSSGNGGFQFFQ